MKLKVMVKKKLSNFIKKATQKVVGNRLIYLEKKCFELESIEEAKKFFGWNDQPIISKSDFRIQPNILHHINDRRLKDALILATAAKNINASAILEIGTFEGKTTVLLAENAPQAKIITINITPEEIEQGGVLITGALPVDKIGWMYKEKGLTNVELILQNTISWTPDLPKLDMGFIDGCHDTDVVISDTLKILPFMKSGGYIFWHDFNPVLLDKFPWISSVCKAINIMYKRKILSQPIFFVKNSFVGIYKIP